MELPVLFSWESCASVAVSGAELTPAELLPAVSVQGDEAAAAAAAAELR